MKCEKCRERAANVFITRVVEGQSFKEKLCEPCAREGALAEAWLLGTPVPEDAARMPLDKLLLELFAQSQEAQEAAANNSGALGADSDDDKWSLQKLAELDSQIELGRADPDGFAESFEFSSDEDEADEEDEVDSEDEIEFDVSPEEMEAALEEMEPHEREAVSQMLEALDEVQQHLEDIMVQRAHELEDSPLGDAADSAAGDETLGDIVSAVEADPFADDIASHDPFADDAGRGDEATPSWKSTPTGRCAKCHTTWDRMREDGRAGCPACYEIFAEPLAETLERMQSASQHAGKAPRAAARRQRRLEHLRARRDSRLALLRERLEAALKADQFEEASKLRDKIRIVESTIVDPEAP
jgi:protein-arginine kinase activator protein McsA